MFNTADPTQWIIVFAILFALTFIAATAFAYSLFWYFHEKETARDEYPEAIFGLEEVSQQIHAL